MVTYIVSDTCVWSKNLQWLIMEMLSVSKENGAKDNKEKQVIWILAICILFQNL